MSEEINKIENLGTLGKELKSKRTTLGKSVEDVVKSVKLRATVINALESGDVEGLNQNAVYIIGYVKNYSRFLKMDKVFFEKYKEEINNIFADKKIEPVIQNEIIHDKEKVINKRYTPITYAIIVCFIAFVVYQTFKKTSFVDNTNISSISAPAEVSSVIPEKTPAPIIDLDPVAPILTDLVTKPENTTIVEEPSTIDTEIKSLTPVEEQVVESIVATELPVVSQLTSLPPKLMEFTFTEDTWLSVKDAKGSLSSKVYLKGSTFSIDKLNYPVSIVIGNVMGTQFFINGKKVKLPKTTKNTAFLNYKTAP